MLFVFNMGNMGLKEGSKHFYKEIKANFSPKGKTKFVAFQKRFNEFQKLTRSPACDISL